MVRKKLKKAFFQMFPTKAPGSNDFHAHFFQRHWDVCGASVIKAVFGIVLGKDNAECINDNISSHPKDIKPDSFISASVYQLM